MTDSKEDGLRAALEWYAEQVAGCRKITREGNTARHALDADGGKRAREALSASSPPVGGSGEVVVKPLEWEQGEARSSLGDLYSVHRLSENVWSTRYNGTAFPGWMPTEAGAIKVAQDHHNARIRSALAAPVPNGVPEGAKPDYWALWSPSGMHIGLWSERKLAETAAEGFSAGYRIQPLYASPVPNGVPEGWRDLSTAPTDGTHILVRFDGTSSPPTVAHWFGPPPLPGLRAGGWYLSVQQLEGPQIHPTRWMPVPEDRVAASPVTPEGLGGGDPTSSEEPGKTNQP
jgi:hypothetical protein